MGPIYGYLDDDNYRPPPIPKVVRESLTSKPADTKMFDKEFLEQIQKRQDQLDEKVSAVQAAIEKFTGLFEKQVGVFDRLIGNQEVLSKLALNMQEDMQKLQNQRIQMQPAYRFNDIDLSMQPRRNRYDAFSPIGSRPPDENVSSFFSRPVQARNLWAPWTDYREDIRDLVVDANKEIDWSSTKDINNYYRHGSDVYIPDIHVDRALIDFLRSVVCFTGMPRELAHKEVLNQALTLIGVVNEYVKLNNFIPDENEHLFKFVDPKLETALLFIPNMENTSVVLKNRKASSQVDFTIRMDKFEKVEMDFIVFVLYGHRPFNLSEEEQNDISGEALVSKKLTQWIEKNKTVRNCNVIVNSRVFQETSGLTLDHTFDDIPFIVKGLTCRQVRLEIKPIARM